MYQETKLRSISKAVSWRVLATLTTFTLVLIFTGEMEVALTVGGLEVVFKMLIYFSHERGWDKIKWGKHEIQPFVVWMTGLSGAGKTSIAKKVAEKLQAKGLKTEHLDGETIRDLFPDTGFSKPEVNEHIKRVGLLAGRLENKGVFVVASFISPYKESREFVRDLCKNFIEVYISTPLKVCEKRENNNLYKRARLGEIKNLPGIDVKYEIPQKAELIIDTSDHSINESVNIVYNYLKRYM